LFAVIAVVLASALDWAVTSGLHKVRDGNYSEWNDIRDGAAAADVIIQGSSRAWTTFSPAIISESTGMTCYNLGIDGYTLDTQLARYQMFREYNPKPKVIVQALDVFGFVLRDKVYKPVQFLAYLDDPFLRQNLAQYQYFTWFDHALPLVRYRGEPATLRQGTLQLLGLRSSASGKVKGYQGQDQTWDPAAWAKYLAGNPNGTTYAIAPALESGLEEFLRQSREEGILVVLVYPPEFIEAQPLTANRAEIMGIYTRLADKYGFPLLDYSDDPICLDTQYFYNSQHMNARGAEKFSAEFAADLRWLLQERTVEDGLAGPAGQHIR
jgi:hypothetical protein